MQLRRLSMYGFKSFADKTEVEFGAGITGIVGPNGSGKSNISDAIRFVLGEQNIRNVRGNQLLDVIFKGSRDRRAAGVAEVSLTFDNDGSFGGSAFGGESGFKEVAIQRRIFRTGESEFFINRSRCRLKDIVDLFSGTGIGVNGISIISQNRIDDILKSKPEDRRVFFEETVGVTKYRNRKRETLHRIEDTEVNMVRIADILHELESQLDFSPEELKHTNEKLTIELDRHNHQMQEFGDKLTEFSAKLATEETVKEQLNKEVLDIDQKLKTQSESAERIRRQSEAIDRDIARLTERQNQGKSSHERLKQSQQKLAANLEVSQKNLTELKTTLQSQREEFSARQRSLKAVKSESEELETRIQTQSEQRRKLEKTINKLQQELSAAKNAVTITEHDLQILRRMQQSYEGFGKAPKAVLMSKAAWRSKVYGAVGELFAVPEEYTTAIDIALGSTVQNIITEDELTAKAAIEYLKHGHLGRVTFLPLNRIAANAPLRPVNEVGAIGFANTLIKVDTLFKKVADYLLGRTLIVDNIDNAIKISRRHNVRIVTLEGEVFNVGGSISGGSVRQSEINIFSRSNEIEALQRRMQVQLESVEELSRRLKSEQAAFDKFIVDLSLKESSHKAFSKKLNRLEIDCAVQEQQIIRTENQLELLQNKIDGDDADLKNLRTEEKSLLRSLSQAAVELAKLTKDSDFFKVQLSLAQERSKSTYAARMECLTKISESDKALRELNRQISALKTQQHESELAITDLRAKLETVTAQLELASRHEFLKKQLDDLNTAKANLTALIADMDDKIIAQFLDAFKQIQLHFATVFVQLFGGGSAQLELTDKDDILNTGVEIMVTLPNKKRQPLSMLSGGERALTVIALLFAFLRYKPSPFCILDEVDAPLDEANLLRFGTFLKEFSANTQFILITHRKTMMEFLDVIYGITIEETAVSKVLSVKLNQ